MFLARHYIFSNLYLKRVESVPFYTLKKKTQIFGRKKTELCLLYFFMFLHGNLKSPSFHLSSFEITRNVSLSLRLDFQTHFGRPGGSRLESSRTLAWCLCQLCL
ncbi:hypothetical protein GDO78_018421 [Eleutherodactylus coqui]|uniref:Uncharacterized protein n=1 Tax=Eleutherodactylus coqui TaxID=57060 RepID=A0A8J6BKF9_ELECQ|nr:hypothetical protein GDO78_018421 [Eleutherodactylus coqui]